MTSGGNEPTTIFTQIISVDFQNPQTYLHTYLTSQESSIDQITSEKHWYGIPKRESYLSNDYL